MELEVYKLACDLSIEIYVLTQAFPKEEKYSLTDQIRRSSRSVGAQLAEAWAKRRYPKHFISKLTEADGEQLETQHWLNTAQRCGLLAPEETLIFRSKYERLGKQIQTMIEKSHLFCRP